MAGQSDSSGGRHPGRPNASLRSPQLQCYYRTAQDNGQPKIHRRSGSSRCQGIRAQLDIARQHTADVS